MKKISEITKQFKKENLPKIEPGDIIKVYQKLKEKDRERIQVFEGVVIAIKHGREIGATITVRRAVGGIGVERIFPVHLPSIDKIEIVRRSKVRRAKLYYLRKVKGKKAKLKRKDFKKKTVVKEQETHKQETSKKENEVIAKEDKEEVQKNKTGTEK